MIAIVAKRDHLVFFLGGARSTTPSVQIQPLEAELCPVSWTDRRVGSLTIKLPPGFADERDLKKSSEPFIVFSDGRISVMVSLQTPLSAGSPSNGSSELRTCLARRGHDPIRLLADMYSADRSQFRLGMTREEVRDLDCLLRHKVFACSPSVKSGREFHDADVSGLLLDRGESFEEYDWCCLSAGTTGSIIFEGRTFPVDRAFVKRVCTSLRFSSE